MNGKRAVVWLLMIGSVACYGAQTSPKQAVQTPDAGYSESTFGDDLAFLQRYGEIVVLTDSSNKAKVAVSPAWQGRVMTSTAQGDTGRSLGWINREHIASKKIVPHMNVFGGEERFWLGPEGGQFSIFHGPGKGFGWDNWQVPPPLDSHPFELVTRARDEVIFRESFPLVNYSGTHFQVSVERTVRLLDPATVWARLGLQSVPHVSLVAFESSNVLTNSGTNPWQKESGLLSIWIAGMHPASTSSTFIVPIRSGSPTELGSEVTADYFLPLGPDRLKITNSNVTFRVDARYQSKIGISPKRSLGKFGSYDPAHNVLTVVLFSQPQGVTDYVKSLWRLQENPLSGDAINSYNDGPATPGARAFGPFYEMESSSPAAALAPGASIEHRHLTVHLVGPKPDLERISRVVLGVSLDDASAD